MERYKMLNEEGRVNNLGCLIVMIFVLAILTFAQIANVIYKDEINENKTFDSENIFVPDKLQVLFLRTTEYSTREEIEEFIRENGLFFETETYGGSWEETQNYKIAYNFSDAQHRYSTSGDYIEIEFDNHSHKKLKFMEYYNFEHDATARFTPPRSYRFYYYDLSKKDPDERKIRRSCRDSWDAIEKVMAKNR